MRDLRADLKDLYRSLSQTPATEGGRTVMFMSARSGEGASSVATAFALLAAESARKPVWLIDLDLKRNHLFNTFAVGPFADAHEEGCLGGASRPRDEGVHRCWHHGACLPDVWLPYTNSAGND